VTGYDPASYGEALGAEYDTLYPESQDALETDATVTALATLAGESRSVLEFGIGTGRVGLLLVELGFRVAGIEASEKMASQLREKPRGREIDVVIGDFADAAVGATFSVVALIFNTVFGLPTREAQIACFRNAERHMEPGGCFVVEAFVLRPEQLTGEWTIRPRNVQHEHVELQLSRYDAGTHRMERTLVHVRPAGARFVTVTDNYAWPGELDLLASAAGLRLRSRAGGWAGEPFDASSHRHVSVYVRA
jgi:SAM-dependent methyltransferase